MSAESGLATVIAALRTALHTDMGIGTNLTVIRTRSARGGRGRGMSGKQKSTVLGCEDGARR